MSRPKTTMRRTMRHLQAINAGLDFLDEDEQSQKTSSITTKLRHAEAAAATVLWLGFFPAVYFIESGYLNCTLVFLIFATTLHAYTRRPYCMEFDDVEAEALMELDAVDSNIRFDMGMGDKEAAESVASRNKKEELKLVFVMIILLCAVGSAIAFSRGGADVVRSWVSKISNDCSVVDLSKLQSSVARFRCSDGVVDLSQTRSLLAKGGGLTKTYTDYRIAPVYLGQPSKAKKPVAWSVSKNAKLLEKPCGGQGLCGTFSLLDDLHSDQASFKSLTTLKRDEVVNAGAPKFDQDSIPMVILTDPGNPEGKAVTFFVGVFFYFVVLVGLSALQYLHFSETEGKKGRVSTADGGQYGRGSYNQLVKTTSREWSSEVK